MKTKANDTLSRSALLWLLLAQALVIIPQLSHLPLWTAPLWLCCANWRTYIYHMRPCFPGWVECLLLVMGGAVFAASFTFTALDVHFSLDMLIGLNAAALLLVVTFIIKLLELFTRRDAQVFILLEWAGCLTIAC